MKFVLTLVLGCITLQSVFANTMPLKGVGLYSDLSAKYYYGALYSQDEAEDEKALLKSQADMRMEMRFIADKVSPRRFSKLFNDMIAINNSTKTINQYTDEIIDLTQIVQDDLLYGDRVVVERINGDIDFYINKVKVMETDNSGFINVLLRGWIGLLPPTPSFKKDLLSGKESPHELAYDTLDWDASRQSAIANWATPIRAEELEQQRLAKEKELERQEQEALRIAKLEAEKQKAKVKAQPADISKAEREKQLALQLEKERQLEQQRIENERKRQQRLAALKAKQEAERKRLKEIQVAESTYYKSVIKRAMQTVVYPRRAYERKQEGLVKVRINIDKNGNVKKAEMIQSSSINMLDAAALMSAKKAQPYPKVPSLLAQNNDEFEFTIPYRFKAQ